MSLYLHPKKEETVLKIQSFKMPRKTIYILLFLFMQLSVFSQNTDSINYDYNSNIEIRTSENINEYLNDDFYLYDKEIAQETETWWQKIIAFVLYLISRFFFFVGKGGKPLAYTFYIVILFVFIFILSKLLGFKYQTLFLRSRKIKGNKLDIFEEDIHGINFNNVIEEAEKNKNYRRAIRFLYIKHLKLLADNELIDWQIGKTNKDYEKEMKDSKYFLQHKHLSVIYEHIWYGEFNIERLQYKKYKKDYNTIFNDDMRF